MSNQEKLNRTLTGVVVSNKMDKTIVVLIERKVPHPKYGKYVTRRTKVFAHDENNSCQAGDKVIVKETRPLSRHKNWMLLQIVGKATQVGESS